MRNKMKDSRVKFLVVALTLAVVATLLVTAFLTRGTTVPVTGVHNTSSSPATGASSTGSHKGDTIKVTKAYTNATQASGGELLIKAASSDSSAKLLAYRKDGTLIGEVQNGGGGQYGGTVMPHQTSDPVTVTIASSSGGKVTVATTPFQQ